MEELPAAAEELPTSEAVDGNVTKSDSTNAAVVTNADVGHSNTDLGPDESETSDNQHVGENTAQAENVVSDVVTSATATSDTEEVGVVQDGTVGDNGLSKDAADVNSSQEILSAKKMGEIAQNEAAAIPTEKAGANQTPEVEVSDNAKDASKTLFFNPTTSSSAIVDQNSSANSWSDIIDAAAILAQQDEGSGDGSKKRGQIQVELDQDQSTNELAVYTQDVTLGDDGNTQIHVQETVESVEQIQEIQTMVEGSEGETLVFAATDQLVDVAAEEQIAMDTLEVHEETVVEEEITPRAYSSTRQTYRRIEDGLSDDGMAEGDDDVEIPPEETEANGKVYRCPDCDFKCFALGVLYDHKKEHPLEGKFRCADCDYANNFQVGLQVHSVVHSTSPQAAYSCPLCDYSCTLKRQINKHANVHTGEKMFKCKHCDYQTDYSSNLHRHWAKHDTDSEQQHQCDKCNYTCATAHLLQKHVDSSHIVEAKPPSVEPSAMQSRPSRSKKSRKSNKPEKKPWVMKIKPGAHSTKQEMGYSDHDESIDSPYVSPVSSPARLAQQTRHASDTESAKEGNSSPEPIVGAPVDDCCTKIGNMFKCMLCPYQSKFHANVKRHQIMHRGGQTYSCDVCDYITNFQSNLKRHYKLHDVDDPNPPSTSSRGRKSTTTSNTDLQCELCDYKTTFSTNLKRHYSTHTIKHCPLCDYTTVDKKKLGHHIKHHDEQTSLEVIADSKGRRPATSPSEASAFQSEDEQDDNEYQCKSCSYITDDRRKLESHRCEGRKKSQSEGSLANARERRGQAMLKYYSAAGQVEAGPSDSGDEELTLANDIEQGDSESSEEETSADQSFSCSRCHFQTTDQNELSKHTKTHDNMFHCEQCDFSCSHESWLVAHRRVHIGDKLAFQCQMCAYSTPLQSRLKAHMMTHTGEKPYQCIKCDFAANNSSNLYRHIRMKHDPKYVAQFKRMKQAGTLRSSTEIPPMPSPPNKRQKIAMPSLKIFRCSKCDYSAVSKEDLNDHKEVHEMANMYDQSESGSQSEDESQSPKKISKMDSTNPSDSPRKPLFVCDSCDFISKEKYWLDAHKQTCVPKAETFKCKQCNFTHKLSHMVEEHEATHLGGDNSQPCTPDPVVRETITCTQCTFIATSKEQLEAHTSAVHDTPQSIRDERDTESMDGSSPTPDDSMVSGLEAYVSTEKATATGSSTTCEAVLEEEVVTDDLMLAIPTQEVTGEEEAESVDVQLAQDGQSPGNPIVEDMEDDEQSQRVEVQPVETVDGPFEQDETDENEAEHTADVLFQCKRCSYNCVTKTDWSKHLNMHAKEQLMMFKSAEDSRDSDEEGSDDARVEMTYNSGTPLAVSTGEPAPFVCTECNYTCKPRQTFIDHMKSHGVEDDFNYQCQYCDYTHPQLSRIARHARVHTGEKPFQCGLCDFSTADSSNLCKHKKTIHGGQRLSSSTVSDQEEEETGFDDEEQEQEVYEEEQPSRLYVKEEPRGENSESGTMFTCNQCDFSSKRRDWLEVHMKSHEGVQIGYHHCTECDYSSRNYYNLIKHMRVHTGEKPFKCAYCSYDTADSGNLNKHIRAHHKGKTIPNKTPMRKKSVKPEKIPTAAPPPTITPVKLEQRRRTSAPAEQGDSKLFQCDSCEYTCAREKWFLAHMRLHEKDSEMYRCTMCDYVCQIKNNLVKHMRTHTGEKPFKCQHCVYTTADKGNLNKHVKSHHLNSPAKRRPNNSSEEGRVAKRKPAASTTKSSSTGDASTVFLSEVQP